jgi:hypothetical protein
LQKIITYFENIIYNYIIIILSFKQTMTDFHFVITGTVKGESKEIALEILKSLMKKNEGIKDISELHIFGKTL